MKVDAIVLAGALNTGKLKEASPEPYEATIPVHGKALVNYVIAALQKSTRIQEIVVVAPREIASILPEGVTLVQAGDSIAENVTIGASALKRNREILIVTSDIPFIHREAIDDFLGRCEDLDADLYYPIVSQEANEQLYPGTIRTYVKLKEGIFTGGNIILIKPQVINNTQRIMEKVIAMRKKPWQLARLFGFMFVIKFFLHQLSLSELEKRFSHILGFRGVAIISPYPEIGTDVDKPSDLELAEKVIGSSLNNSKEA